MKATATTTINDPIATVVALAATRTDQGALRSVVAMISAAPERKRAQLWDHFARSIGRSVRGLIVELRKAYEEVEAEREANKHDPQSEHFDAKAYGAKVGTQAGGTGNR